jgi:anti-sigma factor RsiW
MSPDLERVVAGLRCREVLAMLAEYVDDSLGADERASVEAHVRECAQCAAFGHSYSQVVTALQKTLQQGDLDLAMTERLEERLREGLD